MTAAQRIRDRLPRARSAIGLVALGLAAMAPACGDDGGPARPPLRWESAHFRYAAWPDDTSSCADVTDLLEEHWSFWHDRLGLPAPAPSARIAYWRAHDDLELWHSGQCPYGAGGCTTGTEVSSYLLFDQHELIHAYLGETMPPPVALFAEGAAVAFSCDAGLYGMGGDLPSWRELLDPAPGSGAAINVYPLGGQLVTHLVKTAGAPAFIQFYASIGALGAADTDAIAERFQAAFGVSLDDAWTASTGAGGAICLHDWTCSRAALPLDGAPHAGRVVCDLVIPSTLHLAAAGNLAAGVRGASSIFGLYADCDDAPVTGGATLFPGGDLRLLADLGAGTYVVNLGAAELTGTLLSAPAVGPRCDGLVPFDVAPDGLPLFVTSPSFQAHARLHFSEPRDLVLEGKRPSFEPTAIWTCPDCASDAATCPHTDSTGSGSLHAVFSGDSTWILQATRLDGTWPTAYAHDPR